MVTTDDDVTEVPLRAEDDVLDTMLVGMFRCGVLAAADGDTVLVGIFRCDVVEVVGVLLRVFTCGTVLL